MSKNWIIAGVATVCFIIGVALSHRIEPGVQVQKVTLAEQTPALKFLPAGPGPHPVALLAHGFGGSKKTLFRYAEALTAAGFVCYDVDLPGHGASPRTYTYMDAVHMLEAVSHEVGPLDVFVGHSLGGSTGGEAVWEGGMRPGLFIAIGSSPVLGDHAPPLLLLVGRFDELVSPALLKMRTDARLVISPRCDHVLEMWDPLLVNTAVEAACSAVHKTPPAPPTAWRWRLVGIVLAILAAGRLALYLPELFPRLARFRGLLLAVFFVASLTLTVGFAWLDTAPHRWFLLKQGITMAVTFLLATVAGRLRIPRGRFAVPGVLLAVIAFCWWKASGSYAAFRFTAFTGLGLTPALIAGIATARHGSRLQGDIAMAIIVGWGAFQWFELPRMAPEMPKSHDIIKLDAKLLDACVGEYEFPPDNAFWLKWKMTIRRQGDQLLKQTTVEKKNYPAVKIYPESETNFFGEADDPFELTFVNNDKGEATAVMLRYPGWPVREGKKLKNK